MNRSHSINFAQHGNFAVEKQKVAYHEAGHAMAQYFNAFLIKTSPLVCKINVENDDLNAFTKQALPFSAISATSLCKVAPYGMPYRSSNSAKQHALITFYFSDQENLSPETHIINLLCGPLAEAKFVAILDNELFKFELFNIGALQYYRGETAIRLIYQHLCHYTSAQAAQTDVLTNCLHKAFQFVDNQTNWQAIKCLADYILSIDNHTLNANDIKSSLGRYKETLM